MKYRSMKFNVEKDDIVINFLKEIGISNRKIKELSINRLIKRNDKALKYKDKIYKYDQIELLVENEEVDYEPIKGELHIVFENDEVLLVYKDRGITVNSSGQESIANHIAHYFIESNINSKIRFVNRIDFNSRGLLIIAKSSIIHGFLQKRLNDINRQYIGIVRGNLPGQARLLFKLSKDGIRQTVSLSGKKSITDYKSLYNSDLFSIVDFTLITGRNHQIRASMKEINHPLIGDQLYNGEDQFDDYFLLAYKVSIPSIYGGEDIEIELDYKDEVKRYLNKYLGEDYEI